MSACFSSLGMFDCVTMPSNIIKYERIWVQYHTKPKGIQYSWKMPLRTPGFWSLVSALKVWYITPFYDCQNKFNYIVSDQCDRLPIFYFSFNHLIIIIEHFESLLLVKKLNSLTYSIYFSLVFVPFRRGVAHLDLNCYYSPP